MKNIKKVLIFVLFVFASVLAFNLSVKAAAGDVYKLVTDAATLAAGDEVIIANAEGTQAISTNQKSNNRGAVAVAASGDTISFVENLEVLTLKQGNASGTFALCGLNGKYLTITTSNGKSNYLRSSDTIDELSSWKISITDGVANIEANTTTYARKYMKYNPNNGGPLFSCYSSGQQDIAIYKKASVGASATQLATPVATLNGKTVSWGAVANASSYSVKVTNKTFGDFVTYSTTNTSYTVDYANGGECEVSVTAVGDNTNYLNSTTATAGTFTNEIPTITISEFLALEVADKNAPWYKLTGKVTNIINTTYGNFTLVDKDNEEVSVYVYGLTSTIQSSNDKSFASLNIVEGEVITLYAYRAVYNNSPQVNCGAFVERVQTSALESFKLLSTKTSMIINYQKKSPDPVSDSLFAYEFTEQVFTDENSVLEFGGVKWNLSVTWKTEGSTSYYFDSNNGRGQQIGSGSKPATSFTLTTESAVNGIKSLELNASGASGTNATVTVTVGGVQLGQTVSLTSSATVYRFTSETALNGAVEIAYSQTTSKAFYVGAINIYKEAASESLTSASMRFGTVISKAMYDELVASGATAWGVEIKAGDANATQIACAPVRVNAEGVEDVNGEYYQFALVINKIGYANIDTVLTAKVFVEINDTKTYMNEASHSLRTLVDTYLAANDKSAYEDHLGVLNHLSAYGK